MELTGNKWIDLIIAFISGGGVGAAFNLVWKLITGRLEWRKMKIDVDIRELEYKRQLFDLIAYMDVKTAEQRQILSKADETPKADLVAELSNQRSEIKQRLREIRSAELRQISQDDSRNN